MVTVAAREQTYHVVVPMMDLRRRKCFFTAKCIFHPREVCQSLPCLLDDAKYWRAHSHSATSSRSCRARLKEEEGVRDPGRRRLSPERTPAKERVGDGGKQEEGHHSDRRGATVTSRASETCRPR